MSESDPDADLSGTVDYVSMIRVSDADDRLHAVTHAKQWAAEEFDIPYDRLTARHFGYDTVDAVDVIAVAAISAGRDD